MKPLCIDLYAGLGGWTDGGLRPKEPLDVNAGTLEVGHNDRFEVVINHPDLKPDADGVGHIVFSPRQARHLANLLLKHADQALTEWRAAHKERQ
jgi:hypothetical protein